MISRQLIWLSRDHDCLQTFHSQVTLFIICIEDNQAHDQFLLLASPDGCHNALKIRYDNLLGILSWGGLASCLPGIIMGLGTSLPVNDEGKIIWLKGRGAVIDPTPLDAATRVVFKELFFQTSHRC